MMRWFRRGIAITAALTTLIACEAPDGSVTTLVSPAAPSSTLVSTTEAGPCPDVFCLVYHIRPDARWSDGVEVTAADLAYSLELLIEVLADGPELTGYELISGWDVVDEKTLRLSLSQPFAPWRTLLDVVYPSHAPGPIGPESPTSGPFVLKEWVVGDRIVMSRNPSFRTAGGALPGDVSELWFVFPEGVRSMIQGLEDGEIDVINPRPLDWMVSGLAELGTVSFEVGPGPFWEHIDFNHSDPLLSQLWVRQAIAMAIDRETILDATIRPVFPEARPLDSTLSFDPSANYAGSYRTPHDPSAAEQMLIDHFCERDRNDVYSCQGRRMSFLWATTAGDVLREAQLELAVEELAEIGVEVVPRLLSPSELFSEEVFFGGPEAWQIISFSWKAAADPYLAHSVYQCQGGAPSGFGALNVNRYCNEEVADLVTSALGELDPEARAEAYRRADGIYLEELAMIPLYQKPSLLAWNDVLSGPRINPWDTDLWNVGSWSGKPVVVVALGSHPTQLAPPVPFDDAEAMVRSVLYQGVFEVRPDGEFVPTLVESVDVVAGDG